MLKPGAMETGLSITFGNACHAQAGGIQFRPRPGVMRRQQGAGIVAHVDMHVEGVRHRIRRDVVMRRPDAAGREHRIPCIAQVVQGADDGVVIVADHPDLGQRDARFGQLPGQVVHVGVAGAPGQDFVADDEHGGSGIWHHGLLCRVTV